MTEQVPSNAPNPVFTHSWSGALHVKHPLAGMGAAEIEVSLAHLAEEGIFSSSAQNKVI